MGVHQPLSHEDTNHVADDLLAAYCYSAIPQGPRVPLTGQSCVQAQHIDRMDGRKSLAGSEQAFIHDTVVV